MFLGWIYLPIRESLLKTLERPFAKINSFYFAIFFGWRKFVLRKFLILTYVLLIIAFYHGTITQNDFTVKF